MSRRDEAEEIARAPAATPGGPGFRPFGPRRREAGELIASGRLSTEGISAEGISAGVITGSISSITIAPRQPGEYIDMVISYSASNPKGGSTLDPWRLFIISKDNLGNKDVHTVGALDRITDPSIDATETLKLWQMPNEPISLEVRLYAHQELKSWNWDWWK